MEKDAARPLPPESLFVTRWTRIHALHGPDAEHAWQWFVERYRPFVHGILQGMLGHTQTSKHAEEEFWGYIWMSGALQRADRGRRFRAFLSGIVRNFSRTFARQRKLAIADEHALDGVAVAGDASELHLWVDNVIANAMAELQAENPSAALALASFYGLAGGTAPGMTKSATDVAAAIGNTTQGVYMLLFRGRKRMRELIEAELREGCHDDDAWRDELRQLLGITTSKLPGLLNDGAQEPLVGP